MTEVEARSQDYSPRSPSRRSTIRGLAWIFGCTFLLSSTAFLAYTNSWLSLHPVQATQPQYSAPTPSHESGRPPTREESERLLVTLDQDFNARDLESYLGEFSSLHSLNRKMLAERLSPVFTARNLRRKSKINTFRQVGNRAIALVNSQTWDATNPAVEHSEETGFLVSFRADGETRALFHIEVDAQGLDLLAEQDRPGVFNCLACNYRIQSNDDWLLVPHSRLRAGCIESISFYSLYHDLCVDLSVHIDVEGKALNPATVLADLTSGLRASAPEDWLPPAYGPGKMSPPVGLHGARVDVTHEDGQRSLLRLAVYGPIRYLMAVRGPAQTLVDQQIELQAVLATFEVIDPIFSPGHVANPNRPSHLIGKLDGGAFVGDLVQFSGPAGWHASRTADWSQFHITYRDPNGSSYVKVRGMPPPKGLKAWTKEAANLVVTASLEGAQQQIIEDQGWQSGSERQMDRWFGIRSLELLCTGESQDRRSLIRLALAPDILVVCEANGEDEHLAERVDSVFASLKQR